MEHFINKHELASVRRHEPRRDGQSDTRGYPRYPPCQYARVTNGLGRDGSLWATSRGFAVKPDEVKTLVKAYADPSGIRANGLHLGGEKYITLRADDRSIYGKKVKE